MHTKLDNLLKMDDNLEKWIKYDLMDPILKLSKEDLKKRLEQPLGLDATNKYPIHFAVQSQRARLVHYFISNNKHLIDQLDGHKQTPLMWAVFIENENLVRFFVENGANLYAQMDCPNSSSHGKNALFYAAVAETSNVLEYLLDHMDSKKPIDTAGGTNHGTTVLSYALKKRFYNNAILIARHQGDIANVIPLIKSAAEAMELMVYDAELVPLILKDARLSALIEDNCFCNITAHAISYYKLSGRRPSFYIQVNKDTHNVGFFTESGELGSGTSGVVRLFSNPNNEPIAVKSLKKNRTNPTDGDVKRYMRRLEKEAEFNNRAYPAGDAINTYHAVLDQAPDIIYTNRYIMPYIRGQRARVAVPEYTATRDLALFVFKTAEELNRLHSINIVHGDVFQDNIMLTVGEGNSVTVQLIDFGHSYNLTDGYAPIMNAPPEERGGWYPPEICELEHRVKPDESQTTFALAFSLRRLLESHKSYGLLIKDFPCIQKFIFDGLNLNPDLRPSLIKFAEELGEALEAANEDAVSDVVVSQVDTRSIKSDDANDDQSQEHDQNGIPMSIINNNSRFFKLTNRVNSDTSVRTEKQGCCILI